MKPQNPGLMTRGFAFLKARDRRLVLYRMIRVPLISRSEIVTVAPVVRIL